MEFELINVGIADLAVAKSPDILRTILGSCVGICLYDPEQKAGGLSHIMLPDYRERSRSKKKYADTAIPLLIHELEKIGAKKNQLQAKIIGGATMFKLSESSIMKDIGKSNIKKVKEVLAELSIKIIGEDLGGDYGRTIDFFMENGNVKVKSIGRMEKII